MQSRHAVMPGVRLIVEEELGSHGYRRHVAQGARPGVVAISGMHLAGG